jgi:protein involved in polysaccharide export with SLBB domain
MEVLNDSVKLGIGDRVSLRIIEERRVPISLIVRDSGEMEVPLIGRVMAKGKTCKQLAYELKPVLEKEYFYKATVIVGIDSISTRSRGRVYITGQVRTQGGFELPTDSALTVSQALVRAGGLADFANRRKVKLVRKKPDGTSSTQFVDLVEILDKGHLDKDIVLEPGDLINVPERLINF